MSLWTGTSINSNATAMVFNQLYNRKAIAMVRKKNGLLYAILGKAENGATPMDGISFEKLNKVTGDKVEVKLMGKTRTIPTVADGSAEVTAVSLSYNSDVWGGAVFPLTHYADSYPIPHSELYRFGGDEAKTANYLDDVFDHITVSVENTIGTGINGTGNQLATTMGSWQWAVSDGVSAGETAYATYGTIDRSSAGNEDFQGNVTVSTGTLTLAKIRTAQNAAIADGGLPRVGVGPQAVYGTVQGLVEAYTQVSYDDTWSEFGGIYCRYGGITFILDQRTSSGVLGLLDPDVCKFYQREYNFTTSGIVIDPGLVAGSILPYELYCGFIVVRPSSCAKLTGIS